MTAREREAILRRALQRVVVLLSGRASKAIIRAAASGALRRAKPPKGRANG